MESIYRLRSLDALLGERNELENQEIFFASSDNLNDPMEGFKDFIWQGDLIVWRNLLKHYILCLDNTFAIYALTGEEESITEAQIPVFLTTDKLPTTMYKDRMFEIYNEFFQHPSIEAILKYLSTRKRPIRRSELSFYFQGIHSVATHVILKNLIKNGLIKGKFGNIADDSSIAGTEIIDAINTLEDENQENIDQIEALFKASETIFNSIKLNARIKNQAAHNKRFVLVEYPEKYFNVIEKMIYSEWYVACFMSDCRNPSSWAHYGDSHKGCCLKFKLSNRGNHRELNLKGVSGWSYSKTNGDRPIIGNVPFIIHKVEYSATFPEIDFFTSMGAVSNGDLQSFWFTDEYGNRSICADKIFSSNQSWRENHWKVYQQTVSTKLSDWSHEKEYRAILTTLVNDYSDKKHRLFSYNFSNLEGIIFGIKTSDQDKIKIIETIKRKCIQEGRSSFDFFQAYYSKETGKIETYKLEALDVP